VYFEGDDKWYVATVKEIKDNGVTRIWYEQDGDEEFWRIVALV
jgi:hypothetical protein